MEQWIRRHNYASDYYRTIYNIYTNDYPGYPLTYYQIDFENSIYDRKYLMAGSYEKMGVGILSGLKWKKILLLPVYGIESIQPVYSGNERGMTLHESIRSSFSFPTVYNLKPSPWDFIHFDQQFMSPETPIDNKPMFVVTNIELASYGNMTHYKCPVKVAPIERSDIEKQITSYWMFLELTKKIHNIDTANILLKFQNRIKTNSSNLESLYNRQTGFFLKRI